MADKLKLYEVRYKNSDNGAIGSLLSVMVVAANEQDALNLAIKFSNQNQDIGSDACWALDGDYADDSDLDLDFNSVELIDKYLEVEEVDLSQAGVIHEAMV